MYLDNLDGLGYFRLGFRATEKNGKTRAKGSQLAMHLPYARAYVFVT